MSKITTAISLLKNNPLGLFRAFGVNGLLNYIPDSIYLRIIFFTETKQKLDLKNPKTYNEKIQWLKLYNRRMEYISYCDKYDVRTIIQKILGEKYLIELIDVWDNVSDINWHALPDKFVLKCTHGSSSNIICKNKKSLDIYATEKKLRKWMKYNWYWFGREWPYKNVKPRIICEELLETYDGMTPIDYKFMCFNGEPKLIQVHRNRFKRSYTKTYYDRDWNKTNIIQGVPNSKFVEKKPSCFDEMIEISKKLSKDIPYIRVDLFEHKEAVYFGELTLYPTSGFENFSDVNHDILLGSWIDLGDKISQ
jgi:hypothetical protein